MHLLQHQPVRLHAYLRALEIHFGYPNRLSTQMAYHYWPSAKGVEKYKRKQLLRRSIGQYYRKIIADAINFYLITNSHKRHCFRREMNNMHNGDMYLGDGKMALGQ